MFKNLSREDFSSQSLRGFEQVGFCLYIQKHILQLKPPQQKYNFLHNQQSVYEKNLIHPGTTY